MGVRSCCSATGGPAFEVVGGGEGGEAFGGGFRGDVALRHAEHLETDHKFSYGR